MTPSEEKRARELSRHVAGLPRPSGQKQPSPSIVRPLPGKPGAPGANGSPDTAEQIVEKINTLEGAIDPKVIKGVVTADEIIDKIRREKSIDISQVGNAQQFMYGGTKYRMSELMHGGGSTGGSGTVTDVSVATANGFLGTVATSTTTPVITIKTSVTGLLKGNGTAVTAGTAGDVDTILPTQGGNSGKFLTTNGTTSSWGTPASGTGTVTTVSVVSANGLAGTVANATTTPAITLTTSINSPVLAGNGTAISAATTTGTGSTVVLQGTPTLTTPVLGAATATSINKMAITAPATSSTLAVADGKTLTASNTLTFTGTDTSSVNFGAGGTVLYSASTIPLTVGSTTIASGTSTRILYDNAGVLGEYTLTGSGTVVAMATSPSFTTPTLGVASATSINKVAITAPATSATLTIADGKTLTASNTMTLAAGADSQTWTFPSSSDTVVTLAASQTLTSKTLTSPTIQTSPVLAAATSLKFTVPSSDVTATGVTTNEFNSGYSSTAIGDLVYLDSSATWQKADADASATTYSSMLGIALSVASSGNAVNVLLQGFVYAAGPFPTFTSGAPVYMSATAGAVTQTAPTTTDSATRIVGYAVHADKMYFNPSNDWITHT